MIDASVVMVNYRTSALVEKCLDALAHERATWPLFDVTVVEGGSGDCSAAAIAEAIARRGYGAWVSLLTLPINGGFGYANNEAIRRLHARTDPPRYVHLLNPDAIPEPGAVRLLHEALERNPAAGSAGSLLVTERGRAQGSAFTFPTIRSELVRGSGTGVLGKLLGTKALVETSATAPAEWVTGASVMIRMQALEQVGLFDEGFFLYYEEVELMRRLHRAGWTALHVPASRVEHVGGASTGILDGSSEQRRLPPYWYRSRRRYFARTRGRVATAAASLAWLAGSALWRVRCSLGLGRWSGRAPYEGRDFLRHGLFADRQDMTAAVPAIGSPVDRPPAWMQWRDGTAETAPSAAETERG